MLFYQSVQAFFLTAEQQRPNTPPCRFVTGPMYTTQHSTKPALTIGTRGLHSQPPMASPPYPSTPASTSSSFSHYGFHPYGSHSRSTSSSTNARSTSPAMSVMSAATSLSSASSGRFPPPPLSECASPLPSRGKLRKNRLMNQDRKEICLYSQVHPDARQEDIATAWGVERSTISKILKNKDKWLAIHVGEEMKVAKHRSVVFVL